jgi:hypothetical protein
MRINWPKLDIHSLGIGYLEEVDGLRLQLHELALGEFRTGNSDRVTFLEPESLHHPVWKMYDAFFCDELQNTCVRGRCRIRRITKLEHPW